MKLPDNVYNILKFVAQCLLPGLATLYFALAEIWGFPYPDEIMGTIMALDAFLGVLLGLSAKAYYSAQKQAVPSTGNGLIVSAESPFKILIQMSSEVYDALVWIAQYGLPSLGTFVFALTGIWGFEIGDQIVGTIAAIDTFLGILLGISNAQYKDARKALPQENY